MPPSSAIFVWLSSSKAALSSTPAASSRSLGLPWRRTLMMEPKVPRAEASESDSRSPAKLSGEDERFVADCSGPSV